MSKNGNGTTLQSNEVMASVLRLSGSTLRLPHNIISVNHITKLSVRGPDYSFAILIFVILGLATLVFLIGVVFLLIAFIYWRQMKTKNFLVVDLSSGSAVLIGPYTVATAWRAAGDIASYLDAYENGNITNNYAYDIKAGEFKVDTSSTVNNFGNIERINVTEADGKN